MRNLTALLLLLSLCSLHLVFSGPLSFDYKTACCSGTIKAKIPLKNIVTYWRTKSDCPTRAIVFQTRNKGKKLQNKVCVDPTADWVNSHMRAVDRKNNTTLTAKP